MLENISFKENINDIRELIDQVNQNASDLMDDYYIRVTEYRKDVTDKSNLGRTGIVTRPGKEKYVIYYYWCKFTKNRLNTTLSYCNLGFFYVCMNIYIRIYIRFNCNKRPFFTLHIVVSHPTKNPPKRVSHVPIELIAN